MQPRRQQSISDRCTCQWLVQPGSEHLVSLCGSQAPRVCAHVCVCVCVSVCVCYPRAPDAQYPDTTHIVFFSGARKKGKLIYRAVWHWSTRMHDWLGLMEFSALDLHFSLSARSRGAHKRKLAAARLCGSYVSDVISSRNCYQEMFAPLPIGAQPPSPPCCFECIRGYGSTRL